MRLYLPLFIVFSVFCQSCQSQVKTCHNKENVSNATTLKTGAQQTEQYISKIKGKNVALVINQTAEIKGILLVDTLLKRGIKVVKIFGPEHGFRGNADAGEKLNNEKDVKTGIPIVSLYGTKEAPSSSDLAGVDVVIFDIQDVGARFYTYSITLAKLMQACADNHVPLMVLDRPNPNGNLIDGPILEPSLKSGVGIFPIPISHGLTMGEFANMVNGEKWLKNGVQCDVEIIKNDHYKHEEVYILPVKPSPNLNNQNAIYGYPSICLFEGTCISLGRGTQTPFQVIGHPSLKGKYNYSFTPKSIVGMSKNPPLENQECFGVDLKNSQPSPLQKSSKLNLYWLLEFYKNYPDKEHFFNAFFDKLAGNTLLKEQIKQGLSEKDIRKTWEIGLIKYKLIRKKYLLYP